MTGSLDLGGKNQTPKPQRAQRDHAEIAERTLRRSATDSVTYLPVQPLELTERCDAHRFGPACGVITN
jgi:hypothetical protein